MAVPETSYNQIQRLVEKFKSMSPSARRHMNEHATRQGYILPLFRALGWDIDNIHEVSPEEKVSRGWVDFSFRIGGIPRLFLETKKASEDLNDPRWVRQAVDYAWTKSVTWALLSDFEELRVFNAEIRADNPFQAQFIRFDLDTYLSDFERLWWLSRPETEAGRLNAEAEKWGKKTKRLPVSLHLFDDLKNWRMLLYKDLVGFNKLSPQDADYAVLRILNRLLFIRTAEDRQVESPILHPLVRELEDRKQLQNLSKELSRKFRELDEVYNSELFAPHFSEGLFISSSVLQEVIEGLYEKNFVLYNFNAIEADVLGTAYEQYLGAVVTERKTNGKSAGQPALIPEEKIAVEERRQKRKSQGIYYTPAFVTKYIVQQTLGRYLEERSYNPSRPPRVLDMSCGSGSFLIEAFDILDRFVARMRNQAYGESVNVHDHFRRMELLDNCIFGVDKDKQAVEVARLNLLLRALHSRQKLPMLENIYHGDSLLAETWERGFPAVMQEGGFDVIIGNPPYVRQETLGEAFKAYAKKTFTTYAGTADLYIYFIEQAHRLLKSDGYFGMIVSNKWLRSNYGKALRDFLKRESNLMEIIDFGELPVFGDVLAYPLILLTRKKKTEKQYFVYASIRSLEFVSLNEEIKTARAMLDDRVLQDENWALTDVLEQGILEKMRSVGVTLGEYVNNQIYRGVVTGYNNAFVIDGITRNRLIAGDPKSEEIIKPYLLGRDVHRYKIAYNQKYLIFTRRGVDIDLYDAVKKHLENFKDNLIPKPSDWGGNAWKGRKPGTYEWFEIQDSVDYFSGFEKPKIVFPSIVKNATFSYDQDGFYSNDKTAIIPTNDLFLLGILNSKVSDFILRRISSTKQGGYFEQKPMYISQLPIRQIDFSNPTEKSAHDGIVKLVEEMLALQKERQALRPEADLDQVRSLEKRIAQVDAEIDRRVYALYGLTEEEIRVVEG